jgi:hypothetical protein
MNESRKKFILMILTRFFQLCILVIIVYLINLGIDKYLEYHFENPIKPIK